MRILLTALAFAIASVAVAQTCDMNMSISMSHKGAVVLKNSAEYKGLTQAQAADIVKRSMVVIDEASKAQNKRGDYTFTFDGTNTCGITMAAISVDGLTHKDSAKVWRQAFKVAEGTIKTSEIHVAKGGKGPWGK
jgi:hypothetical protein